MLFPFMLIDKLENMTAMGQLIFFSLGHPLNRTSLFGDYAALIVDL